MKLITSQYSITNTVQMVYLNAGFSEFLLFKSGHKCSTDEIMRGLKSRCYHF